MRNQYTKIQYSNAYSYSKNQAAYTHAYLGMRSLADFVEHTLQALCHEAKGEGECLLHFVVLLETTCTAAGNESCQGSQGQIYSFVRKQ